MILVTQKFPTLEFWSEHSLVVIVDDDGIPFFDGEAGNDFDVRWI
jgi:hypothetical protein